MKQHYPLDPTTGIENAALPWTNGNPGTGVDGSYPSFGLFLDPQAEILAAQRAGGLTDSADGSDTAQLSQAISRGIWLGTISQPVTVNDLVSAVPGSVVWPALRIGMEFGGVISAPNTGPMTVTLNGFITLPGKLNLVSRTGSALVSGDVAANAPFRFRYDGTAFRLAAPALSELKTVVLNTPQRNNTVPFTTGGTYQWPVPTGVNYVFVRLVGGGGGSSGGNGNVTYSGGGGGSGGYSEGWVAVTPGQIITVVVGYQGAGVGNTNGGQGNPGGTTSFGSYMSATGGGGGRNGSATSAGGSAGLGSGGQINLFGSVGGDGNPGNANIQGGQGAASAFGGGGRTATTGGTSNGLAPGSGAGGIWGSGGTSVNGGNGADGAVFIQY